MMIMRDVDFFDSQFCLVTRRREPRILAFVMQKFAQFSILHDYLRDRFLLQEGNFTCVYTHTLRLLHLLQISRQHILLESLLSKEASSEFVRFAAYVLDANFFQFDAFEPGFGCGHFEAPGRDDSSGSNNSSSGNFRKKKKKGLFLGES